MFDKSKAIDYLININGIRESMFHQMETTVELLRQLVDARSPEKTDQVINLFRAQAINEVDTLLQRSGAVIGNVLTDAELEAVYTFYSSDHGKAIMAKLPLMIKAGTDIGKALGVELIRWTEKALAEAEVPGFKGTIELDL